MFRHGYVDAAIRLHYAEVEGSGPPLLLIHGIGMDWRVWQAISRRLSQHFHVYTIDLRGHGQSDKPAHGYTLAHYAADIEDVVEALQLHGVTLVGSSLGGAVSAVVEAPLDLVSARVLVDPPLTGGPIRDEAMFWDILRLKQQPEDELAHYLARRNPGAGMHLMHAMSEMWHAAADGVIEDMLASRADYYAIDSALQDIESPTLLMQADLAMGGVLSDDDAQRAKTLLANGSLVRMPGAGHAIHAYKPREFTEIVRAFAESSRAREGIEWVGPR
ncbi:MAG TPA: alpha/beta hydrolase [Chloroflexota bacterium]